MLMLSMGITLTIDDFKRVLSQPKPVGLGFILCYAHPATSFDNEGGNRLPLV
ncbi:hypothetical protein T492DRAFT_859008 [Pavlovales sp. CCMP2436]|nr:hypothetical protein T492DRAFT_859008 [Pavlovales sp. CCMP2436]